MVVDSMNQLAGWERIIKIESVNKKGMYAPLTKSGTLIGFYFKSSNFF